eukprot:5691600-Amphidinium_carterae.1
MNPGNGKPWNTHLFNTCRFSYVVSYRFVVFFGREAIPGFAFPGVTCYIVLHAPWDIGGRTMSLRSCENLNIMMFPSTRLNRRALRLGTRANCWCRMHCTVLDTYNRKSSTQCKIEVCTQDSKKRTIKSESVLKPKYQQQSTELSSQHCRSVAVADSFAQSKSSTSSSLAMANMGFSDTDACIAALHGCDGNMNKAFELQ